LAKNSDYEAPHNVILWNLLFLPPFRFILWRAAESKNKGLNSEVDFPDNEKRDSEGSNNETKDSEEDAGQKKSRTVKREVVNL
jgi:hypothetical protein